MNVKAWIGLVIIAIVLSLAGILPAERLYMTLLLVFAIIGSSLLGYYIKVP